MCSVELCYDLLERWRRRTINTMCHWRIEATLPGSRINTMQVLQQFARRQGFCLVRGRAAQPRGRVLLQQASPVSVIPFGNIRVGPLTSPLGIDICPFAQNSNKIWLMTRAERSRYK